MLHIVASCLSWKRQNSAGVCGPSPISLLRVDSMEVCNCKRIKSKRKMVAFRNLKIDAEPVESVRDFSLRPFARWSLFCRTCSECRKWLYLLLILMRVLGTGKVEMQMGNSIWKKSATCIGSQRWKEKPQLPPSVFIIHHSNIFVHSCCLLYNSHLERAWTRAPRILRVSSALLIQCVYSSELATRQQSIGSSLDRMSIFSASIVCFGTCKPVSRENDSHVGCQSKTTTASIPLPTALVFVFTGVDECAGAVGGETFHACRTFSNEFLSHIFYTWN